MKQTPRRVLQRPTLRKDVEIGRLESEISARVNRLAELCKGDAERGPNPRFTFFWNNQTNGLRRKGMLLPGDGKGGLITPQKGIRGQ